MVSEWSITQEQGKQEAAREKAKSHQLETPARCSQAWAATSATVHYIREGELRGTQVSRAVDCRYPRRLRTLQFLKLKLGLSNAQCSSSGSGERMGSRDWELSARDFKKLCSWARNIDSSTVECLSNMCDS